MKQITEIQHPPTVKPSVILEGLKNGHSLVIGLAAIGNKYILVREKETNVFVNMDGSSRWLSNLDAQKLVNSCLADSRCKLFLFDNYLDFSKWATNFNEEND